tara:strand:- start:3786 stop:4424 length:639 start_codon:yes stop_codon:yes gene_type:complete
MKNKIITFDSKNIFLSIKKIVIFDRKALLITVAVSLVISLLSFNYYEKNKSYIGKVVYSYLPKISLLGEVEMISQNSFINFANNENSGRFDIDYGGFPTFYFNVNDKKLINEAQIEIEKLLNDYKKYLINSIKRKISFLDENKTPSSNQEMNKLKYTLLLLNNDDIFYNKQTSIIYPDKILIFLLKFFSLIFLSLFFIRFIFLFLQRKIKLL